MSAAAAAAVACLGVGPGDAVLVLCNEEQRAIARAIAEAARLRSPRVRVQEFARLDRDGAEPPAFVAEAMAAASVVFAPTTASLSHTGARVNATRG